MSNTTDVRSLGLVKSLNKKSFIVVDDPSTGLGRRISLQDFSVSYNTLFPSQGGGTGDCIPFTGNDDTNPITGSLYFQKGKGLEWENGGTIFQGADSKMMFIAPNYQFTGSVELTGGNNKFGGGSFQSPATFNTTSIFKDNAEMSTIMTLFSAGLEDVSYIGTKGLKGFSYYGNVAEDNHFIQKKYVDDRLSEAIPLAGTEVGKPVTGNLEVETSLEDWKIYKGNGGFGFRGDTIGIIREFTDRVYSISIENEDLNIGYTEKTTGLTVGIDVSNQDGIRVEDQVNQKGITGQEYYGANYDENTYIQKKYIDDKIMYGATTIELDGVETEFTISHNMGQVPTSFAVTFEDAGNLNFVQSVRTITATEIKFTCTNAPLIGSQKVYWQVFR